MKIAIIGAGNVGSALGTGWARAGHAIVFGVRDVQDPKVQALCNRTGGRSAPAIEAAREGDVVVLALPWSIAEGAVKGLGDLNGKIVIDCMNPLAMKDGVLGLDRGFTTSGAETLATWIPRARIVKTLNQVGAEIMGSASGFAAMPVMFMAGDNDGAKAIVGKLLTDFGFEPLDAGGLAKSRLLEPFAMVWINQSLFRGKGRNWAFGAMKQATS